MWVYYYRLFDKYGPGVVSLAILADADPAWRPHAYETEIAGCRLSFEFPVFKVLEFTQAEETFDHTENPFALVLAAHRLALATKRDPVARYQGRFRLIRHLRRQGLEQKDLQELWRVIHVLTRLPRELELQFKAELVTLAASEGFMTTTKLITPWDEIAMEEGRVEGLMEGILSALETRFGTVPEGLRTQLKEIRDESRLRHAMRLALTEPTLDRFQARF